MTEPDHIPAPSGHAPRLSTWVGAFDGIILREGDSSGRWIHCENPEAAEQ